MAFANPWLRGWSVALGWTLAGCAGHSAAPSPHAGPTGPRARGDCESPYTDPASLKVGDILQVATGRLLSREQALHYITTFPVVFFGETHDSAEDHAVELAILEALQQRYPGKVALGMEMLAKPVQTHVDAYVDGGMSEADFEKVWAASWGATTWPYYRAILQFARAHHIPIMALNVSDAVRRAVGHHPLADLDPSIARQLPKMDMHDPYHRAFAMSLFGGHKGAAGHLQAFYRVQVLWDESMAHNAAAYLQSNAGRDRHLLVLAGSYHVRYGFGIPRRFFRRLPLPYTIVTTHDAEVAPSKQHNMMQVQTPTMPMPPADIIWSVRYEGLPATPMPTPTPAPADDGGISLRGAPMQ